MVILCAVDGETTSDPVVQEGRELADAFDDELVVTHVMSQDRFDSLRTDRDDYYVDDAAVDAAETARDVADATLSDGEFTTEGRVGNPAAKILELGSAQDARFIVIGGRKRSPVGKAVFGSVTQSILLDADRPVTTVMSD